MQTETGLLDPTAVVPEPSVLNQMCRETQLVTEEDVVTAKCATCGNEYRKAFRVIMNGKTHHFDCFECAIQLLAPSCAHCGCTIIGHGVEHGQELYCCQHCARHPASPPSQASAPSDG